MNLKDTYFGFTNGKKAMQAGKIEKSLDLLCIRLERAMKEKENVYHILKDGYTPAIKENYSYYSPKKDDYTKPRTLYKLEKDGSFFEVNKTLYNYALHLIDNDFLNEEKAQQFIENEAKEEEEREILEKERLRKEQEAARKQKEKEEAERKRVWNKKREAWRNKGNEFMNEDVIKLINDTVDENINKFEIEATPEQIEQLKNDLINKMPEMLGNQGFAINQLQYHMEDGLNREHWHIMTVEAEILMSVFNVTPEDGNRTITAKVKAKFEGREYKGKAS
ncbi:hypothetical protein [Halobacillus litoralis]|uniref:hypothetical protein n=1 Tax=Halobacillus litoralis TaxID=45668 RepID=UPI001CD3FAF0|nr:hypothetical protein [Halobacillus litoralis]MCA1021609.1 hypothetical protein [Halobacillus litoralis]